MSDAVGGRSGGGSGGGDEGMLVTECVLLAGLRIEAVVAIEWLLPDGMPMENVSAIE